MRVIIVGGSGLIGRALASDLVNSGSDVVVLSRDPARTQGLPEGVKAAKWDGRTSEGWGYLADGASAIVNLAGENLSAGRWTPERKQAILESRVMAGRAVVQAVGESSERPHVVVQASAVGYYGPHGDEEIPEDSPAGSDFLARVCLDWEASTAPVESLGVRRVIARTGVVLSTRGGALPGLLTPARLFVGGPLGSGRQWFPWIHLADEVAAFRFLMENEAARGPFNLCAPAALTNAGFSRALGRALGRPALIRTPATAVRILFGEMATIVLTGQRATPTLLGSLGFTFRFPDAQIALRDLLRS